MRSWFLKHLELGTDGVLLKTSSPNELAKTIKLVKEQMPKITLTTAKILSTKPISSGARVCVDTVDLMVPSKECWLDANPPASFWWRLK